MKSNETRYLLICNVSDGLIAQLNGVVIQLQLARRMGFEPIVYLHKRSFFFGGPNPYFEESLGPNIWDYYCESIGISIAELPSLVRGGKVFTLATTSELLRLYRWEPKSWFMNPFGYFRSVENRADGKYPSDWWQSEREKARLFLEDGTVRFKASIHDQVKMFIKKNFSEETLGLQLRGSDKYDFGVGPNLSRHVLPDEYFPHIDRYLADHPKCTRIFVATDQRQWLKILEEAYPGKIVSFSELSLSDTDNNMFLDAQQKAARGVEALVDLLLLSHCSFIIKCHAAVGEMALVLNPKLEFLDLNYEIQPFKVRSRHLRAVFAPGIRFMCSIWRTLAENGMALAKVVSVEEDRIMVEGFPPRTLNTRESTSHRERIPVPPLLSSRFVSEGFRWSLQRLGDLCFTYEERKSGK